MPKYLLGTEFGRMLRLLKNLQKLWDLKSGKVRTENNILQFLYLSLVSFIQVVMKA